MDPNLTKMCENDASVYGHVKSAFDLIGTSGLWLTGLGIQSKVPVTSGSLPEIETSLLRNILTKTVEWRVDVLKRQKRQYEYIQQALRGVKLR